MKIIQDSGEGSQIGGNDIVRINRAYKRFFNLIQDYNNLVLDYMTLPIFLYVAE